MTNPLRPLLRRAVALGAALASACSTGGGHAPAADCSGPPAVPAGQAFTVSGNVTYDFVPAVYSPITDRAMLDFSSSGVQQRPVREAIVQIQQCGTVLQTTATDTAGHYSATFTPGQTGAVGVFVLAKVVSPPIVVRDNTADATWAVSQPITSATATVDVHATHGWTGTRYGPGRIAAPFAILDTMYTAAHRLLDAPLSRTVAFDAFPLTVNWSPLNSTSNIGGSAYDATTRTIWVVGADGSDTDEFDRPVIAHEWSHYFEDAFSRADSLGGAHYYPSREALDPTLAFSEGYATAFAGMLFGDRMYADTSLSGWGFDLETAPVPTDDLAPGAFSEMSVVRALWDLYDGVPPGVTESWDATTLGLGPIYDTLVGPQRTTPALTTIASFVAGLKEVLGNDAAATSAVDAVLARYTIGPITTAFGDGDLQFRGASGIYADVPPPSSTAYSVTATLDGRYRWNERQQNQYFVFTAGGTHATVGATSNYDVDLYAFASGVELARDDLPYSLSRTANLSFTTTPGTVYVVVLNGWGGLDVYGDPTGAVGPYSATVTFSN